MRVLDLDLDAFVHGVVHFAPADARPSAEDFPPWSEAEVVAFLESQCGLSTLTPLEGELFTHHDEAYDCWRRRIQEGSLVAPLDVVHVDGHADLGLGDAGYMHVTTELLHVPMEHRALVVRPSDRPGMTSGNYLVYSIACGMVGSLEYVYPPGGGDDEQHFYFRDGHASSGWIELPAFPEDTDCMDIIDDRAVPVRREQPVSYSAQRIEGYRNHAPFDFASLAISPSYSPTEAEGLIEVFARYINF